MDEFYNLQHFDRIYDEYDRLRRNGLIRATDGKPYREMLALSHVLDDIWEKITEVCKQYYEVRTYAFAAERYKRIKRFIKPADFITYECTEKYPQGTNQFYLVSLLDENVNIMWGKIGTTQEKTGKRFQQYFREKTYKDITYIIVHRVYDCGDIPPEYFENLFKSYYMTKYKNRWVKNDRFQEIKFNLEEADSLFKKFKKMYENILEWD